jgi:hypothetical protein
VGGEAATAGLAGAGFGVIAECAPLGGAPAHADKVMQKAQGPIALPIRSVVRERDGVIMCSMPRSGLYLILGALSAIVASACGGTNVDSLYGDIDAGPGSGGKSGGDGGSSGDGGQATGGVSATGGKGGAPATGGTKSTGGTVATGGAKSTGGTVATGGVPPETGGALNTGGSGGTPDSGVVCKGPTAAGNTSLCLTFTPEKIRVQPMEPKLDGRGSFLVQVFSGPDPNDTTALLSTQVFPDDPNGEIAVTELPVARFEGKYPSAVYVRAIFFDNADALVTDGEGFGTWIAGADLSRGITSSTALPPIDLADGKGNDVSLDLTALRKLEVTVKLKATPVGDGEGPLAISALHTETPVAGSAVFGYGTQTCAQLQNQDVTIAGFVIGSGTFYVAALLNDLGGDGALPPGSISALDVSQDPVRLTSKVTVGPEEYGATANVNLTYVAPLGDAGPVPPNSCADITPPTTTP